MIVIFGAPGAGKTEQGRLLAAKYGWQWVSSRDLLLGLKDRDVTIAMNNGMYVSDDKNIQAMSKVLGNGERGRRMVLDGFPNSVQQVYWMRDRKIIDQIEGVISLSVPRGELWMRIQKRGRVDDTRAAFERRVDLYERAVWGMLHVLKQNGIRIATVNGCNSPADVLARIEEKLGEWEIIAKKDFQHIRTDIHL